MKITGPVKAAIASMLSVGATHFVSYSPTCTDSAPLKQRNPPWNTMGVITWALNVKLGRILTSLLSQFLSKAASHQGGLSSKDLKSGNTCLSTKY
jgi:hypothetical protein